VEEGCNFVFWSDIYLVAKSIQFQIYRIKTTPTGKGRGRCDKLIPSIADKKAWNPAKLTTMLVSMTSLFYGTK
jgi:hypothetical protein